MLLGLIIGIVVTGAASAVVMRWIVVRSVSRARLAEQRATAAERMAEIGAMTGGLAHEIKNPLSTIGLNAQLIKEIVEDSAIEEIERGRLLRRLDALTREVERLTGILSDFLNFAGEIRLHRQDTDINHLVEELVDFFLPQAESVGVRLRADPAPDPVRASIDPGLLKQAVLNLMLNATQAMSSGADSGQGELILRVRPDDGAGVRIHVIDTGPGIPHEVVEQIFHPYFTTRSGGSGLGLPTSRRIAEAHGGELELHTEAGRGSDFVIVIPPA